MKPGNLVLINSPYNGNGNEIGIFINEIPIKNEGNYKLSRSNTLAQVLRQDGSVDLIASFFLKEI